MCGIVGYVTSKAAPGQASKTVLAGLKRLEYRGYDSAGIALIAPSNAVAEASDAGNTNQPTNQLTMVKKSGKLANLVAQLQGLPDQAARAGIGHTRWATHGGPTDANAHPHLADGGKLAVIHNGIIENFQPLRQTLTANGVAFASETDTEVAAHLLAQHYQQTGDLTAAMQATVTELTGAFTLLAVHADHPDTVVGARHDSPLVVGIGEGENFLGSDVAAFIEYTSTALELDQDQIVTITPQHVSVIGFDGQPAQARRFEIDWDPGQAEKGGYSSFMAKEIHDQPKAVTDTLLGRTDEAGNLTLDEIRIDPSVLRSIDRIIVIACGSAAYAGHVAKYAIEHWCRIPVEVELAHEFRYRDPIVDDRTLVVAISQSGETMDTLMAVRHAREQGGRVLAIVNTHGSTIPREADAVLYTHAGPEVAVASTKAFLAQITAAYLLGLYLAQLRGNKFADEVAEALNELRAMPARIQCVLDQQDAIRQAARDLADTKSVLFLGRHVGYPVALEGALKLKELAYIHAEGFAAGELKHGPIALVEEGQPVFVIVPSPHGRQSVHAKVVSNIQEVRARGARTLVIAEEGDEAVPEFADEVFWIPRAPSLLSPLLAVVPLQIFACELATSKGLDVDQPRNLAKSVTVE